MNKSIHTVPRDTKLHTATKVPELISPSTNKTISRSGPHSVSTARRRRSVWHAVAKQTNSKERNASIQETTQRRMNACIWSLPECDEPACLPMNQPQSAHERKEIERKHYPIPHNLPEEARQTEEITFSFG